MKTACVLVLLATVLGTCYAGIPFKPCDGAVGIKYDNINVYNSSGWICTKEPCCLIKGKDISVNITFEDEGDDLDDVTNDVYGIIIGVAVPFPGFPDNMKDICKLPSDDSSHCPIKTHDKFTESVTLTVIPSAPSITVVTKWEFRDKASKEVGCFEVQLKLDSSCS